jgi:hypothetical protein
MMPSWSLLRELNPTPAQGRDWLKQELAGSDYQSPWLDSVIRWIRDVLGKLVDGARQVTGLSPAVTAGLAILLIALLVWILPKVRRERVAAVSQEAVLKDPTITGRQYRDLAAQAIRDGRFGDAILDGFRAIAKDMSDRGLLNDAPGRTAHEVSLALASPFPDHADALAGAADLFDSVRYGHRRASEVQANQMRALDAELATARPLPTTLPRLELPA